MCCNVDDQNARQTMCCNDDDLDVPFPETLFFFVRLRTHAPNVLGNMKMYLYKELRKATRNFCPGNKLGQGSFGCVYMGKLKNCEKVAIHRVDRGRRDRGHPQPPIQRRPSTGTRRRRSHAGRERLYIALGDIYHNRRLKRTVFHC